MDLYSTSFTLPTWDVVSNVGPLNGTGSLVQWTYSVVATNAGTLIFDNRSGVSATFQACVGGCPYTIGGTVAGLAASQTVVLQNNAGDDLTVSADGPFTFATPSSGYAVTVKTQPTDQACAVQNGSGTATGNVTNVSVVCVASHTFAKWTAAKAFRLGNVNCTAALGTTSNQSGALLGGVSDLASLRDNTGCLNPNCYFPSTWYTPTPPVGTTWSGGALIGANARQDFDVTCEQAIPDPRMHVVNLDTSKLEVTTPASGVTLLSGNPALVVSGNVLNSDYGTATKAGCDSDPSGLNINGGCGTVSIAGSHTTLSFSNTRVITSGDGWQWTLSADTLPILGTVSGLGTGKTVVLQNNLGDDVTISADGSFSFLLGNILGTTYSVTVKTQPAGQICTVTNPSGTATAAVTNVLVTCATNAAKVGGTVSGLAPGKSVVLQNNATDDLTISGNGAFTFATAINSGSAYAVTVKTQPVDQFCTVTNGSGTMGPSDVTNVQVRCLSTSGIYQTPGGPVKVSITGGTCAGFEEASVGFGSAVNPPKDAGVFSYGVVGFTVLSCGPGGTVRITMEFPRDIPPGTRYWKQLPSGWSDWTNRVTIDRNKIILVLTDGQEGDTNPEPGAISDPSGPAIPESYFNIPTLSEWVMLLLAGLISIVGFSSLRRRMV